MVSLPATVTFKQKLRNTPFVFAGSTTANQDNSAMVTKIDSTGFAVHGAYVTGAVNPDFWFVAIERPPIDFK
jgi:hypothetical protein